MADVTLLSSVSSPVPWSSGLAGWLRAGWLPSLPTATSSRVNHYVGRSYLLSGTTQSPLHHFHCEDQSVLTNTNMYFIMVEW